MCKNSFLSCYCGWKAIKRWRDNWDIWIIDRGKEFSLIWWACIPESGKPEMLCGWLWETLWYPQNKAHLVVRTTPRTLGKGSLHCWVPSLFPNHKNAVITQHQQQVWCIKQLLLAWKKRALWQLRAELGVNDDEEFTFDEERYFGSKKRKISGVNGKPPRHPHPGGKTGWQLEWQHSTGKQVLAIKADTKATELEPRLHINTAGFPFS